MVNQDVVNYLNEGKKRGFSVHLLKRKLLEGGFAEIEVDEAIAAIEVDEKREATRAQIERSDMFMPAEEKIGDTSQVELGLNYSRPMNDGANNLIRDDKSSQMSRQGESSGFKWIKTAGICGIILFVIGLSYGVLTAISPATNDLFISNSAVGISFSLVGLILFFFYYFGFVKMGKLTGEKILKVGAWMTIVSVIISVIVILIVSMVVPPQLNNLSSLKGTITILSIVWIVVFLLVLVGQMLFSAGLIKAGRQVKFAKAAGILNVVVFVAGLMFIAGAIMLIYALLNLFSNPTIDLAALTNVAALGTSAYLTVYSLIGMYVLKVIAMVLEFLTLFKASKQFEN